MARFNGGGPESFEGPTQGYRLEVDSASSQFEVDFEAPLEAAGMLAADNPQFDELVGILENEFSIVGNRYFVFRDVSPLTEDMENGIPEVSVRLIVDGEPNGLIKNGGYVGLILDPATGVVVDWVDSELISGNELGFSVRLIPLDREARVESAEELSVRASNWDAHDGLVFCVGGFNPENCWEPDAKMFLDGDPGFFFKMAVMPSGLSKSAARLIDQRIKQQEELQRIEPNGAIVAIGPKDVAQYDGAVLLFCHGIFSTTEGAFGDLFNDKGFLSDMLMHYNDQVIAWDHWTLSKTTPVNADELMARLQLLKDVELDVICHSRGGGVMRYFFEDPAVRQILCANNITVNKCIYVAGACLGSQLAQHKSAKRLFRRINLLSWLFGGFGSIAGPIISTIKALAIGAQKFPGVRSMDPKGADITALNQFGDTAASRYAYMRANYEAPNKPLRLAEQIFWDKPIFGGKANDLIVPYDGASVSMRYLVNGQVDKENIETYGHPGNGQSEVMHTNFFDQDRSKAAIRAELGF